MDQMKIPPLMWWWNEMNQANIGSVSSFDDAQALEVIRRSNEYPDLLAKNAALVEALKEANEGLVVVNDAFERRRMGFAFGFEIEQAIYEQAKNVIEDTKAALQNYA